MLTSLYSQSYVFSSSHVRMWELDPKEGWVPKNLCFQIVVLEKTLEIPLVCRHIKPNNLKGNQPWIFIGKTGDEAEAPKLWSPDSNSWHIGKDPDARKGWRQKLKGAREDKMVRQHYRLNGHESVQTPGDSEGQGNLVCCSPWDTTQQLNNNIHFTDCLVSTGHRMGCWPKVTRGGKQLTFFNLIISTWRPRVFMVLVFIKTVLNPSTNYQHLIYFLLSRNKEGEGNGTPLQYSCLENPMDGGAW